MSTLADFLLALLILINFLLLGSSRLRTCITAAAFQGVLVGLLPMIEQSGTLTARILAIGVIIMFLKGFVFPYLLNRALRESNTSKGVQPLVGYTASLLVGMAAMGASFWMASRMEVPVRALSTLAVPVALFTFVTGLFLIVARRRAANQVLGYIVMENGIYTLALAVVRDIPVLVELGVLMDVFVAVFVMGIAIYRINREFDHIDSDQLTILKG